jgi:hypothetical protein
MEEFRRCCIERDSKSAMTIFSSLSEGMKKRAARRTIDGGNRAIHLLAEVCNGDAISTLVEYGCNKNVRNKSNQTPVMIAAQHNNIDAFTALIKVGAARCTPIDRFKKYQKTIDLYEVVFTHERCDMLKMLLDDPNSHLINDSCTSSLRGCNTWVYRLARRSLELLEIILSHTRRCHDGWPLNYRLGYMLAEAIKAKFYAGVTMILDRDIQSLNYLLRNLYSCPIENINGDVTMTRLLVDRCKGYDGKLLIAAACRCPSEVMRAARSYVIDEGWFTILKFTTYVSSIECLEIVFCALYDKIREMNHRLDDIKIRHIDAVRFFYVSFVDQTKGPCRIPRYADGPIPRLREIARHHLRLIPIHNSLQLAKTRKIERTDPLSLSSLFFTSKSKFNH